MIHTHILPIDDRELHRTDDVCWCDPEIDDGVCIHNRGGIHNNDIPAIRNSNMILIDDPYVSSGDPIADRAKAVKWFEKNMIGV